jgi:hypothetical protein
MARVAWRFNNYDWPINPDEDSGWTKPDIMSETNDVNANKSSLQFGGRKSARRQISGWIWGPGSVQLHINMHSWNDNRTKATLVDHTGVSRTCMMMNFAAKPVQDVREWRSGRQTYKYTAEFIEV